MILHIFIVWSGSIPTMIARSHIVWFFPVGSSQWVNVSRRSDYERRTLMFACMLIALWWNMRCCDFCTYPFLPRYARCGLHVEHLHFKYLCLFLKNRCFSCKLLTIQYWGYNIGTIQYCNCLGIFYVLRRNNAQSLNAIYTITCIILLKQKHYSTRFSTFKVF